MILRFGFHSNILYQLCQMLVGKKGENHLKSCQGEHQDHFMISCLLLNVFDIGNLSNFKTCLYTWFQEHVPIASTTLQDLHVSGVWRTMLGTLYTSKPVYIKVCVTTVGVCAEKANKMAFVVKIQTIGIYFWHVAARWCVVLVGNRYEEGGTFCFHRQRKHLPMSVIQTDSLGTEVSG